MRSGWDAYDEAELAARKGHAARIAAIATLLDEYPALTLAGMLSSRSQVPASEARAWIREATDLRKLPDLAEASGRGELSHAQVAALRVLAEPGTDGAWVETLASPLGAQDFRINELQRLARREIARLLERTDGGRYLHMSPTRDERFVRGRFQLDPEEAAVLEAELDKRVPVDTPWTGLPAAHADALMSLVSGGGGKPTVIVRAERGVLDGTSDAPGELPNGDFVPAGVVRDLAATGRVLELDLTGVDLDTEKIPAPVRRWVWYRDRGCCRGIDCTTPRLWLQIHHIVARRDGGTHHPSNLLLLCWTCHQRRIHRDGWRPVGDAERLVAWFSPDGTPFTPPPIVKRARAPDTS